MIPPQFVAIHRLIHSAWSFGSIAMRLTMAALGFELLLHGAGLA